jgi:UDP:flavonoid glycosyltransferase YjiC (YdhE family)
MVLLWMNIFVALKADVVIANFSPTAMLASRILGITTFTLGTGYYVPPNIFPIPPFVPSMNVPPQRLEEGDRKVTSVINAVLGIYKKPSIPNLAALFHIKKQLFLTYTETDHYDSRPTGLNEHIFLGPIVDLDYGDDARWKNTSLKKVLIYLRPGNEHYKEIILALKTLPCEYIVIIPGLSAHQTIELESHHGQVFSSPVKFRHLVKDCDLAIGYGGHGFTSFMLTYGVPQMMVPDFTEQYILSSKIESIGAGKMLTKKLEPAQYANVISEILNEGSYKISAMDVASKYISNPKERLEKAFFEITSNF